MSGRSPACVDRATRSRWSAPSRFSPLHADGPCSWIARSPDSLGMSRPHPPPLCDHARRTGYLEQGPSRKFTPRSPRHRPRHVGAGRFLAVRARPALSRRTRREHGYTITSPCSMALIVYVARAPSPRRGQQRIDLGLALGSRYRPLHRDGQAAARPPPRRRAAPIARRSRTRAPHAFDDQRQASAGGSSERDREDDIASTTRADPQARLDRRPIRSDSREVAAAADMAAHSSSSRSRTDRRPRPAPRRHRGSHLSRLGSAG